MRQIILFLFGIVIMIAGINAGITYSTEDIAKITVSDKERIGLDDTYKYLVYTNSETFENTDTIYYFKYNSSDLQNDLKIDSTYTVTVTGFRIPFLSEHRNIIEVIK